MQKSLTSVACILSNNRLNSGRFLGPPGIRILFHNEPTGSLKKYLYCRFFLLEIKLTPSFLILKDSISQSRMLPNSKLLTNWRYTTQKE